MAEKVRAGCIGKHRDVASNCSSGLRLLVLPTSSSQARRRLSQNVAALSKYAEGVNALY